MGEMTIENVWPLLKEFADFRIDSDNEVVGCWRVRIYVRRNNGTLHPVDVWAGTFEDIPGAIDRAAKNAQDLQERLRNDEVIPGVNP